MPGGGMVRRLRQSRSSGAKATNGLHPSPPILKAPTELTAGIVGAKQSQPST